ncbi:hypothetical protein MD484_g6563, partial [Candolleomyces efflorescens]
MASVQITTGVQYSISTSYHDGGYLQFPNQTLSVYATLGSYVEDISQQPSDTDSSAFAIANWEFKTYVSNIDDGLHTICSDPDCSLAWAPWSEAGGDSTANEIVLADPESLGGAELWRIVPVGTATALPPNATSSSSTISPSSTTSSAVIESSTVVSRPTRTGASSTQRYPPPSPTEIAEVPDDSEVGQHLSALKNCAPCGSARCLFTKSGAPSSETYSILIGQPVANCGSGTTEATKTTLGGTFELQHSFGVETTTGFSLGLSRVGPSLNFGSTNTEGNAKTISQSQTIEVNIPPGQVGALVANVSYTTTSGRISVDNR